MKEKVLIIARDFVQGKFFMFSWMLAFSIVIPALTHSQYVTGSIINALLIMATILLGPLEAVAIGLIPSAVALSTGLLPLPLAPMVPFIMIGNALLIVCVSFLRSKSYTLAVGVAALVKFAFLYGTGHSDHEPIFTRSTCDIAFFDDGLSAIDNSACRRNDCLSFFERHA